MGRARRWFEYALITAIVCLVPPLVWSEWTTCAYDAARFPPRWHGAVFAALVGPPAWINDALGLSENAYGCLAGASWCREIYIPPPLEALWEFWRVGFPFWLLAVAGAGELARGARRRYRRAKVRAGQS